MTVFQKIALTKVVVAVGLVLVALAVAALLK